MKLTSFYTILSLAAVAVANPVANPEAENALEGFEKRQSCPISLVTSCKGYCYDKWCAGCGSYQPCLNSCAANKNKCYNCCGTKCTTC
ncbi:unnamed protein product [Parascedosporium putredinis]|uniref:Uncharacterized protein n=1 Tax=Parascedosporium putredinis TaxID=1442378 RepID=A0A9P1H433_9PEZI|nr:unnamed protein product [Parascedosporium putredinis]CAI7996347.1 unnamed protein product [Parascedosporium putredinis]